MSLNNTYVETSVTSGAAVAANTPDRSAFVQIQATGGNVRMRADGTNPTTTVGWAIFADNPIPFILSESDFKAARFIAEAATATLRVMPYTTPSR